MLEPGEWMENVFWIRAKCAYMQVEEDRISQQQVEFLKDATQFPHFYGIEVQTFWL